MANTVDYGRLRDQTLDLEQEEEEAVTVNTRALIDKVLARYSGEWTTFRELIQNAADAGASKVSIKFETLPSATIPAPSPSSTVDDASERLKHVISHHTIRRVIVTNNGQPFNDNDWSRLKRIAEGNPDETKIGAFGVGFYSVFADCETPFVASGRETMSFFWKGNSLFTRKGRLSTDHKSSETCFVLDYRNTTSHVPNLLSICQFLSTSLTFIGLEQIDLLVDDWNVFSLQKKAAPSKEIVIPKDIETRTHQGMMRITNVECQNAQIDATWRNIVGWVNLASTKGVASESEAKTGQSLRSFFSRLTGSTQSNASVRRAAKEEEAVQQAISEDLTGWSSATVFIRINTVQIKSQVSSSFATELQRATKKPPPKQTRIAILTSSYDETQASMSTLSGVAAQKAAEIVSSVLPSRNGRIFIGFPTAQTTGLLAHISAPSLIPTVERESIDLNARWVREWNSELLQVAGIACRIAYGGEMAILREKLSSQTKESGQGSAQEAAIQSLHPAAVHTLKQYTFSESTPLARAGQLIEESFWTCNKNASIDMFSSRGILPSHDVRVASEDLTFVQGIPVIPERLMKDASDFITRLQDFGLVSDITTTDIKKELEKQALSEEQLVEFLKWLSHKTKINEFDKPVISSLLKVTVANIRDSNAEAARTDLLALANIRTFLNSTRIPPENPVPPHTIPFRFTKYVGQAEMQSFGWEELQVVPWIRWLLESVGTKNLEESRNITASPAFAAQVLGVLSKCWDSLSQSSRSTLVELLVSRTVMPTKFGMKKPSDSYFASVKLFDDLPTVTGVQPVKEKVLKALGVRKTIELPVIFDRLMNTTTDSSGKNGRGWSHIDLIRYLVSVWADIPPEDIAQLRVTPLCPAEQHGDPTASSPQNYKVSELFEPKDSLRSLRLPILQWPGAFNSYSQEGKFLRLLGLRMSPSVPEIIQILVKANSNKDMPLYNGCLQYFIDNHHQNNYGSFDIASIQFPFLPLENGEAYRLVKPEECFIDAKAEVLLYPILRRDLQAHGPKFGVRTDPPIADCAARLIKRPPQDRSDARQKFGYFARRAADINDTVASKLGSSPIIPLVSSGSSTQSKAEKEQSSTRYITPNACFLGDGQEYGQIFDYVDFGQEANVFLLRVGCKHEPSMSEIARLLVRDPTDIHKKLGMEKYKDLLHVLFSNLSTLKRDKNLWKDMKIAPFLLGYKEIAVNKEGGTFTGGSTDTDENELDDQGSQSTIEWRLRSASKITIVDDMIAYRYFRQHLVVAPQEDALETFYSALGSPLLSTQVDEESRLGPRSGKQEVAEQLRDLIFERARLFLHEQNPSSVRHDVNWLEKNFEVQVVQSISLRRTLRGQNVTHTERRSAILTSGTKSKSVLSITSNYDVWEVSHGVVHLLIDRPKTQHTMIFETFLVTPLLKLRARGYNVDRILRKRAAEDARRAELEKKRQVELQKQQEEQIAAEEKAAAEAKEKNRARTAQLPIVSDAAAGGQLSPKSPQRPNIPGAFQESPDHSANEQPVIQNNPSIEQRLPQNFFSSLSRTLGLESRGNMSNAAQQLQSMFRGGVQGNDINQQGQDVAAPPPYTPRDQNQSGGQPNAAPVTHPSRVDQNLQSAITASRSYDSPSLFSRPQTNTVKEVSSYCDSRPSHDLTLLGNVSPTTKMRVFATTGSASQSDFLVRNHGGLESFASILSAVAAVFGMPKDTLHIYYDEKGSSIAFNSNGSVFCNYRFFDQLHLPGISASQSAPGEANTIARARGGALVYWWVTLCHELAHNLVADHSSDHSYYTEQFVAKYFPGVVQAVLQTGNPGTGSGPAESDDARGIQGADSSGRLLL